MLNLFSKGRLTALLALVSISAMNTSLVADYYGDCCDPCPSPCATSSLYIGAYGGGIYSESSNVTQLGTALFPFTDGGPLGVRATGSTRSTSSGFGGVQIGYETTYPISCTNWTLKPAFEIEAFWFKHDKKGDLINRTDTARLPEHDFRNKFPMDLGVYTANVVFGFQSPCLCGFTPYIGAGVGAARIGIHGADSLQVDPLEPDFNHFNSDRSDSSWAFAAQAKAGLRYTIWNAFSIFAEYRYLFVDTSHYVFGSTVYPDLHAHTTPWNVKVKDIQYNAFAIGLRYDFFLN